MTKEITIKRRKNWNQQVNVIHKFIGIIFPLSFQIYLIILQ
jgi:hypothetical protein